MLVRPNKAFAGTGEDPSKAEKRCDHANPPDPP